MIHDEFSIIALGDTGTGKSTFCNYLSEAAGMEKSNYFQSSTSIHSVTKELKSRKITYENHDINLVDTPGLNDTESKDNEHIENMVSNIKKINNCKGFLIFLNSANHRFTPSMEESIKSFKNCFGPEILNFVVIVWTFGSFMERKREEEVTSLQNQYSDKLCDLFGHNRFDVPQYVIELQPLGEKEIKEGNEVLKKIIDDISKNQLYDCVNSKIVPFENLEKKNEELKEVEAKRIKEEKAKQEALQKLQLAEKRANEQEEARKKAEEKAEEIKRKAEQEKKEMEEIVKNEIARFKHELQLEKLKNLLVQNNNNGQTINNYGGGNQEKQRSGRYIKVINRSRYKGRGRPRNSDYDYHYVYD